MCENLVCVDLCRFYSRFLQRMENSESWERNYSTHMWWAANAVKFRERLRNILMHVACCMLIVILLFSGNPDKPSQGGTWKEPWKWRRPGLCSATEVLSSANKRQMQVTPLDKRYVIFGVVLCRFNHMAFPKVVFLSLKAGIHYSLSPSPPPPPPPPFPRGRVKSPTGVPTMRHNACWKKHDHGCNWTILENRALAARRNTVQFGVQNSF